MEKNVFIFGNGNLSFNDFLSHYEKPLTALFKEENTKFILCDFKGVDTLAMEVLKCVSPNVTLLHIGEKPRYMPDKYKTQVSQWKIIGGFESDQERDFEAVNLCTHFLAFDFNSDEKRKSGTQKSIEKCLEQGKIRINAL
ncbi:hypothetical protein [Flavobacterium hungaricum]|uniref:Uncharacterized protein n=1 Tax=Flavobacterium hungaricum TaxID=2082725 RepID=A0ABR9TG28_9FLAO|nr:hypothetical protein [Flavobacterium hungaricum]MBE8723987.1 hypothetical protein [Flavobacterium hungaricum]